MDYYHRILDGSTEDNHYIEEGLFENVELWKILLTSFITIFIGSLASSVGIGGGGLFVPIFAFILGVGAKASVPLSKACILGAAIGKMIFTISMKNPHNPLLPVVDYHLSTFCQCLIFLGSVFGVFLNILLPDLIVIICLAMLLFYSGYKALMKGVKIYEKEQKVKQEKEEKGMEDVYRNNEETMAVVRTSNNDGDIQLEEINLNTEDPESQKEQQQQQEEEAVKEEGDEKKTTTNNNIKKEVVPVSLEKLIPKIHAPVFDIVVMLIMTIYIIIYAMVKKGLLGNELSPCDAGYWIWFVTPIPFYGMFTIIIGKYLYNLHDAQVQQGYVFYENEMQWNMATLKKFPLTAFITGMAASMLGIGGGMVIGPLFLEMGVDPKVSTACTTYMMVFTAISSVSQYIAGGYLPMDYACWFAFTGLFAGQLSKYVVKRLVDCSGHPSYLVILLGSLIFISAFGMIITGIIEIVDDFDQAVSMGTLGNENC